jgi:hypothetical protein
MKILNLLNPFPHSIIHDFYNLEEQELIWEELTFLNRPNKLLTPDKTGDPSASSNKRGVFLDTLYGQNRHFSNILTINRKIFTILDFLKDNPFSEYLLYCNYDQTMISYYEDQAHYDKHFDSFVISSVTTFWKNPKQFVGGELKFSEFNYIPKMFHNTMIIFPSFVMHEVTKVSLKNNDGINGRYTINQFYSIQS